MEEIYVIGSNHHNTLGVLRSMGYKDIYSNLILVGIEKNPYIKYSKFIKKFYEVQDEDGALQILLNEKSKHKHAVVIACSDGISSALDLYRNGLIDVYALPGSKVQGKLTALMDKEVMSSLGKKVGFTVPQSWIVDTLNDIASVEFPCITKPILSKDGHKSDIKVCRNCHELEAVIKGGSCYRYQVQKFIEKDFEYQLIGLSLNRGEELIIPGFSRCIRPCPGTNTGFLHYESLEDFNAPLDKCKSFVKEVEYSGLFSIEFLRDKNGVDYFMEMNFRNDGNAISVTASGTNLPYIWYLANSGGNYKKEIELSTFKSVYVMPEFADFSYFVKSGKMSLYKWVKDVRKTDKFMEFDSKDYKPFLAELYNKFNSYCSGNY